MMMMEIDDQFVSTIRHASLDEIDKQASSRSERNDVDGLTRLLAAVNAETNRLEAIVDRKLWLAWVEERAIIKYRLKDLLEKQAKANISVIDRVAGITVGLNEELKHDIDRIEFARRVDELFRWHIDQKESSEYMAPYFSMIQSSGTGKTRLFKEFRSSTSAKTDYDCRTILCWFKNTVVDHEQFFDNVLFLPKDDDNPKNKAEIQTTTKETLDLLLSNCTKDKLVLLFDEAQCLMGRKGYGFRCVRWWLRQKRRKHVAAVFSGTTSELANFYDDAPTARATSRDADTVYINYGSPNKNPSKLYDPFFRICTMGCYRNEAPSVTTVNVSDFQRAAFFGRPLFAYLAKEGALVGENDVRVTTFGTVKISNTRLHAILKRMLTSRTEDWRGNQTALCSILRSRVQMGVTTSFAVASELVSKAYAHLVDYHQENKITVMRVSFMPDPVCAALAMGMMNKDWTLTNGEVCLRGMNAKFWSEQAMVLLRSGLCLPEKDDCGEILVALYMLFCGDMLRYAADTSLRTFSVPLLDWYAAMRGDNNHPSEPEATVTDRQGESIKATTNSKLRMEVNFIQVCRNYFRGHSWKTQKALESMYNSATAIYVYPDCEAIDLVASVRVMVNGKTFYHPVLVSVKCWMQISQASVDDAMNNIKTLLREIRCKETNAMHIQAKSSLTGTTPMSDCPSALCLLVLLGAQHDQPSASGLLNNGCDSQELDSFPHEDTFRMISVPRDDSFGISAALRGMTTVREMAEVFSSHGFVYGEEVDDEERPSHILRTRRLLHEVAEFVNRLFSIISK